MICGELLCASKKVNHGSNPDKYLLSLVSANVDFLNKKPQGIELLTLVCFGPDPSQIPQDFLRNSGTFFKCFKKVQLQTAPNSKKRLMKRSTSFALYMYGMITLSKYQTSVEGLKRIGNSLENGIYTLLKGWKS